MSFGFEITKIPFSLGGLSKDDRWLKRFSCRVWRAIEARIFTGSNDAELVEEVSLSPNVFNPRELSFEQQSLRSTALSILFATAVVTVLFVLAPLLQLVDQSSSQKHRIEEISFSTSAPKVVPQSQHRETVEHEDSPPLIMDQMVPKMDLQMMELALQPVMKGIALEDINNRIFDDLFRNLQSNEEIFNFDDLPSVPSILYLPRIRFPEVLIRQNILKGRVVVLLVIDEEGYAHCEGISFSSHPILEALAKSIVSKTRFSVSEMDGVPIKVRGEWPLNFQAENVPKTFR